MTKSEFLSELERKLAGLPQEDLWERLSFYSEMIDDRMEDGEDEEAAVAGIGTVDEVASQIMSEIPLTKLVKEKVRTQRSLRAWEIVLLILGFPVWLPLLIAAFAVGLSLYVVLWSVVISLYAADLALAVAAVACIPCAILYLTKGNLAGAAFFFGAGLACAGLAILLFIACKRITLGVIKLTGKMLLGLKSLVAGA